MPSDREPTLFCMPLPGRCGGKARRRRWLRRLNQKHIELGRAVARTFTLVFFDEASDIPDELWERMAPPCATPDLRSSRPLARF